MNEKKDRIPYIDGLRGLACIFILMHHFLMGFYPATFSGDPTYAHTQGQIELWFSQSPLAFFVNGDFWVSVFCLVSGFVIARKTFRMKEDREHAAFLIKRYPRLALPLFAVSAIVQIMLWCGLFWNVEMGAIARSEWLSSYYLDKGGVGDLFFDSLVNTWFLGMTTRYSNAFWMLDQLFIGSFAAYILAMMGKSSLRPDEEGSKKDKMILVYLIATVLLFCANSRLAVFAIGTWIAYGIEKREQGIAKSKELANANSGKKRIWIGVAFLVLAFILGAYPSGHVPTNLYRFLNILSPRFTPMYFYHMIAAGCLFYGIYLCEPVAKFLSISCFRFLGKISYAVYLIHVPVIYSLTSLVVLKTFDAIGYHTACALGVLVTLVVTIVLSWLFQKFVEAPIMRALKKICG
ncbi:MAG: acyltransferase [Lachnospiraceae bacterium]|nr:acyltransferase [Lachnospiraceae bacterium]